MILDKAPEDRFLGAVYRTTRAILQCKHLLPLGKSLQEAVSHDNRIFSNPQSIDPTSALGALSEHHEAVLVHEGSNLKALSLMHGFAALQVGYEVDDPCLHWFQESLIGEFLPDQNQLLEFENEILRKTEVAVESGGRGRGLRRLESLLGRASPYERRDWAGLPMSRLRDLVSSNSEDDRALMIARLERLARQAEEALDVRGALSALRQISAVQGLLFLDNDKKRRQLIELLSTSPTQIRSAELAELPPPSRDDDDDDYSSDP